MAKSKKNSNSREKKEPPVPVGPYVIGIGASGGGLDALERFFSHLPPDSGAAFVLVTHLEPTRKSMMAELLKKYTQMEVYEAGDDMKVMPGHLYIIPPNKDMAIVSGNLHLFEPQAPHGLRHPIDFFFHSLAQDQKEKAVCVVLSGTGFDGTQGLKDIKSEGGMAMVQAPKSAQYDGMPQSAINTGLADFILSPEEMPVKLLEYLKHSAIIGGGHGTVAGYRYRTGTGSRDQQILEALHKILLLIRDKTGQDFTFYKDSTIKRRIEMRMALLQIDDIADYTRYLQHDPEEAVLLSKNFLIGVTSFFRDPEAFEALKKKALPLIFKNRSPQQPVRVWVPGCSTGEEAYSIAIILKEYMDEENLDCKVQIFATDVDARAIDKAREGIFADGLQKDVPADRLSRFFVKYGSAFQIKKDIRGMVVFAVHDILRHPPFSKLDLLSCRNLMIYLDSEAQRKILPLFQYVLNPDGILFLGPSETIGEFSDLFNALDRKWKIYIRKQTVSARIEFPTMPIKGVTEEQRTGMPAKPLELGIREVVENVLVERYTPACVIVNPENSIVYFHGRTAKFLEHPKGRPSLDIIKMARGELRAALASALGKAARQKKTIVSEKVTFKSNGGLEAVKIEINPLLQPESMSGMFLVVFKEVPSQAGPQEPGGGTAISRKSDMRVQELEELLATNKEYLQSVVHEAENATDELQSSNEELQSSNEELQSMNEELQTSQEELQSVNEELITVNTELQKKMEELSQSNSDMNNLLTGTEIATIFLDNRLRIKRFTPMATDIVKLIPSDIGRPLEQFATNLADENLVKDVEQVMKTLVYKEKEVQTKQGKWRLIRVLPYRTLENVIDGAVITFTDITSTKQAQQSAVDARLFAEGIIDTVREPLLVLDSGLSVITANRSFYATFMVSREETENRHIFELGSGQWNIPQLKKYLIDILPRNTAFDDFEVELDFPVTGKKTMLLNARGISQQGEKKQLILLAIEDATRRKQAEDFLKDSLKEKEVLLKELHHRTKNNMNAISGLINLQMSAIKDPGIQQLFKETQARIHSMALVHEMLYKTEELSNLDLKDYLEKVARFVAGDYKTTNVRLNLDLDSAPVSLYVATPCGLIVNELLSNSMKHAFPKNTGGEISLSLRAKGNEIELTCSDNGIGFPEGFQIEQSRSMGMRLVEQLARKQLMGSLEILKGKKAGLGGKGASIVIRFDTSRPEEKYKL